MVTMNTSICQKNSIENEIIGVQNDIIVVGTSHHNTLGVIRSLGYKGIKPILLLISPDKKSYVAKSKYIKNAYYLDAEESLVSFLLGNFKNN